MIQATEHSRETRLRVEVVRACRAMAEQGYVAGWAGNVSARLREDRFLLTPNGVPKRVVSEDDLLVVDARGNVVDGPACLRPSSELPMHLCAYRRRPDVHAVVHAHPVHAVALSVVGDALTRAYVPEAIVLLGPVAVTAYATPSSAETERALDAVVDRHDAIVLRHHGSVTLGHNVAEAYLRLETLEHASRIVALVHSLGGAPELPPDAVAKLLAQRERVVPPAECPPVAPR